MAVAAAVYDSRDRTRTVADASVQVLVHETEFFEMNMNMESDSPLDVFMDVSECNMAQSVDVPVLESSEQAFDAASQVDDRIAPRILEGAAQHERVQQRTV